MAVGPLAFTCGLTAHVAVCRHRRTWRTTRTLPSLQAGRPQDKVNDLYTVLDAPRRRLMQYANLLRECAELMPNSHQAKLDLLQLQRRVADVPRI